MSKIKAFGIEILNTIYDFYLYQKNSFHYNTQKDKEKQRAFLFKQYHIVEKGLSLASPRLGFGQPKIEEMLPVATAYLYKYGRDSLIAGVQSSLIEYIEFNESGGFVLPATFKNKINDFVTKCNTLTSQIGGTTNVSKEVIRASQAIDFKSFMYTRYSIRDFSSENVLISKIEEAVEISKKTPSVCNRQNWKVHIYQNKEQITSLLELQNGNRGFGESLNKLLIITGDLKGFSFYERNQVFVDGGLFAMSLILSLHSLGLGTCALNTCRPFWYEKRIKKIGNIPNNERLIMYLAVGHLKNNFKIAKSARKHNDDILKIH